MSACSDFAEHVWKPGSCKNCFNPLSAHKTVSGLDGHVPASSLKNSLGGDEEAGITALSSYSKPTIAVKPTMMSLDTESTDVNMNVEQEKPKSPLQRLGLKKLLDLSSLYIDSNGCNKAHREAILQSPESKMDYNNCFSLPPLSPSILPKDSMIISNIFVTQEEGRSSQNLKKNANGEVCRQQSSTNANKTKSTYNASGVTTTANYQESHQASVEMPLSVDVIPSSPAKTDSNGISSVSTATGTTKTSSTSVTSPSTAFSVDITSQSPPRSLHSIPILSKQTSLTDSSCSYRSSTESLPGAEVLAGRQVRSGSTHSPPAMGSPQSSPNSPNEQPDSEPIYAESTKKKRRGQENEVQPHPELSNQSKNSSCSEPELSGEGQRATITVMAAHTEENNRTFYLSSPDSAVSTQCHFSPTARKDPSSPAFRWPSPSHNSPSLAAESCLTPSLHSKPQSSPPIPPKRNNRSPKLGTSSLSPSMSSPVPLPELPKMGTSSLSPSMSSPVPLPELPMLFLVSAKEGHFKVHTENHSTASERWHKSHHHSSGWNCRIEEEEEEEEKERKEGERRKPATNPGATSRVTDLVSGAAVWTEAKDWKAHSSPALMTGPGTAPPSSSNNGACQGDPVGTSAEEEGKHNGSMPSKQPLHGGSSELLAAGKGAANNEANPPPPPPKKLHRVCSKMSGSNMELDRCSQQGSVESPASSLWGLGSASLPTASTDTLTADTDSRDASRVSCASPFARSPVASAPGSPHPPSFNSINNQPPPLPEKKLVSRTVSAPDNANGRHFVRAYPRLPFTGSESNVCRPTDVSSRSSLPSSPVDPRPVFSSNESLERCHASLGQTSKSRTLDEPLKIHGRLGVHCRSSVTCSSSPQLSVPLPAAEQGPAPNLGSSLQLQTLLSNIDSREGVYSKLGGLYAESLRRLALKCEDHFTRSQKSPLRFEESNWSLFRLTSNKPSCNAGDAVYYSAACASDPSNSYAVKICKSASIEARQGHLYGLSVQQSMPPHFNLQQDCGHFLACVPQTMLPSDEVSLPTTPASPLPQLSAPGQQVDQERVVVITPEIPQQTAADFVREWETFHKTQPEVYERRICFFLLQLCNGLEHLKEHGVTHRDLCLENLLLVPHHRRLSQFPQQTNSDNSIGNSSSGVDIQRHLPRLLISNFAKAKRRSTEDTALTNVDPRIKRDHARLAPEIVSAAQYRKFDEFQAGILIYELLHQPNPFEVSPALKEQDYHCEDLPPIPSVSLYSAGLQRLAQLLLQPDPIKRIHIQEAKRILQSLLWGPRKDLMEQQLERHGQRRGFVDGSQHEGLLNWLDVKRALLMMKFAERSLEPERNAELEDWLCCQYFSSAHPLSLCHTAELLYSLK
ncbi:inactive tyrosine-protein kinase PRAG1 [Mastacembelus armatus]|uniref:PEAK1 related, kinase-activating pseudokinase 1 n=1 Tax=Mastacembelus armatus TaxID=205130 RepID=A0A3Q3MK09_9TELE|nr:inactive tyrosine-protein kinase PRAG1 [Mastacembelus armatus]XP_026153579.1 inactive tyrosine-protein kinase PRAG1 [Mastacembelus armatus]XP_026153580.1 inactive tyrosine-protein kinase PRAG1 [Mastacembelus armatus]